MQRAKALLASDQPVKWVFYGDSITHGMRHTFGHRHYVELFAERVRGELGRMMDVIITTAISGNNTRDLLRTFDWRVAQFRPHAVFVMIGMNDCSAGLSLGLDEFERNLHELAERIEALGGLPVLQTTCPILPGTAPDREPRLPGYMDAVRRVAAGRGLPLVDHTAYWQARAESHFFWMSNACHPNAYGHRAFAECLFKCLDIYDPASQTCRLHLP